MGEKGKTEVICPTERSREELRSEVYELVVSLGLGELERILETERTELCGERYKHGAKREAQRGGHVGGSLSLGGRKVSVKRPRVRSLDNKREIALESWERFRKSDCLTGRSMEQMVLGVSTRKYKRSLDELGERQKTRSTSKSSVSRRFIQATRKKLTEVMYRDLTDFHVVAMQIDGITFSDHVVLTALGYDTFGNKKVLGVQEGATESSSACKALLGGLIDRGVSPDRSILFIIDGSKALKKAIVSLWGKRGIIQRCQVHKRRNVQKHLPIQKRSSTLRAMNQAYRTRSPKRAKQLLTNLARALEEKHPGAAASIREGLDETLIVMGMGLTRELERKFSSTNSIESLYSRVRDVSRRVKRWTGGTMILRWSAAGLLEAERGFHKVNGYKDIHRLVTFLKAHDAKIDNKGKPVDSFRMSA